MTRMRTTRSKTGHRRSHHALHEPRLSKCQNCSTSHIRHRACLSCGWYRGRKVLAVAEVKEAKEDKKRKRKEALAGGNDQSSEEAEKAEEEIRPLSVEELSKK